MQSRQTPNQHSRKISYHDMAVTYRNAAPIAAPPPPHAQTAHQYELAQQQEQERIARAKRLSTKPTDRNIPNELASVIVGDGVKRYSELRDAERRLDALMMRKRLDLKDNISRPTSKREGTLRIWISNTADGQPWQENSSGLNEDGTFDFENDNNNATYKVKIEGKLLDAPGDEEQDEDVSNARPKFSSFFKEITIDYHRNPNLHPDGFAQIQWRKQQQRNPQAPIDLNSKENAFDVLEFERKSDDNINVTINMVRDYPRDRFRLSPPLRELLDTEEDELQGVVQSIWEYARAMNLQEDDDKRTITCDEPLQRIFDRSKIEFPFLPELLQRHLQPLPPLKLNYTIRVDKAYIAPDEASSTPPSQPTVYDIRVPLPSRISPVLRKFRSNKTHDQTLKTIIDMDESLALLVGKINETNAKRKFFDNLSKDPYTYVNRWVSSQKRDLDIILTETKDDDEPWRGTNGVWDSGIARESVGLYLARHGQ